MSDPKKDPITGEENSCKAANNTPGPCWCEELKFPETFKDLSQSNDVCLSEATVKLLQEVDSRYMLLEKYQRLIASIKSSDIEELRKFPAPTLTTMINKLNEINVAIKVLIDRDSITDTTIETWTGLLYQEIALILYIFNINPSEVLKKNLQTNIDDAQTRSG